MAATRTVKVTIELTVAEVPEGGFPGRFGNHLDMHWREPQLVLLRQLHEPMIDAGVVLDGHTKPASGKADVMRFILQEIAKATRDAFAQKKKKSKAHTDGSPTE